MNRLLIFQQIKTDRFDLVSSALKGVGEGPVEDILEERKNGNFKNPVGFIRRLPSKGASKKVMESLAAGGAFDCFKDIERTQFFMPTSDGNMILISKHS